MDSFLNFVISKNVLIIEVLFGLILLIALFAAYRWFTLGRGEVAGAAAALGVGANLSELEITLKKILDQAGNLQPAAAPSTEGMSGAEVAALAASQEQVEKLKTEIDLLKAELSGKQKEIEAAAQNTESATMSSGDQEKLEAQIKELQGKLAEYEIISEDIADLSFYKEQTAKLQKEVDELKARGGGAVAAESVQPTVAEVPEPEAEPELEVKPEQAVAKVEPAITGKAAATEQAQESELVDPIMVDPADGVSQEVALSTASEESSVDLGSLDMDKMLSEAAGINVDVPEISVEDALGSSLDENKILKEATAMETSSVSDEDKNLMGQFESFVKNTDKE